MGTGGGAVGRWPTGDGNFQVERAYEALMGFVDSSWELYKAELEAVTFPVFVHCYLILANTKHTDQVCYHVPDSARRKLEN